VKRDQERQRELEAAIRDAVEAQKAAARTQAPLRKAKRNNKALLGVLLLTWAGIAWLWIARPAWVFQPDGQPPLSAEQEEAALRFAMYLQRGRVEAYRQRHGVWPGSVADLDQREEGVDFELEGSGYLLTGRRAGNYLVLRSGMNADSFLGNSINILRSAQATDRNPRTR
jgi:hypothetical protein